MLDCFHLQGGWPFNIESMIVFNIECLIVLVDGLFNIKCLIVFLYKVDGHGQMQTEVLPHVSRSDHSWLIILPVTVCLDQTEII